MSWKPSKAATPPPQSIEDTLRGHAGPGKDPLWYESAKAAQYTAKAPFLAQNALLDARRRGYRVLPGGEVLPRTGASEDTDL